MISPVLGWRTFLAARFTGWKTPRFGSKKRSPRASDFVISSTINRSRRVVSLRGMTNVFESARERSRWFIYESGAISDRGVGAEEMVGGR